MVLHETVLPCTEIDAPFYNDTPLFHYLSTSYLSSHHRRVNREFYDNIAFDYAGNPAWTDLNREMIVSNLVSRVSNYLEKGDRVAVIGAGTGSDMEILQYFRDREKQPLNLNCYGIDLSLPMLNQASRRVEDHLTQAEARELPFPRGSFDFIYCESAAEHFDTPYFRLFLTEMKRVLLHNRGREAQLMIGVRLGEGYVAKVEDEGRIKYFSTFTCDGINNLFQRQGLSIQEQWIAPGGTPVVAKHLPWIQTILKIV